MTKVFIIDDDVHFLKQIQRFLSQKKIDVITSTTGTDAIATFKKEHDTFDVVFLDLHLGDMQGIEVLKKMKQIQSSIPICVMTGLGGMDLTKNYEKMMEENIIKDFLCKPVEPVELLGLIEKYTNKE